MVKKYGAKKIKKPVLKKDRRWFVGTLIGLGALILIAVLFTPAVSDKRVIKSDISQKQLVLPGEVIMKNTRTGKKETQNFYKDGELIATIIYEDGEINLIVGNIPDGYVKWVDNEGRVTAKIFYINNLGEGIAVFYNRNGNIIKDVNYRNDKAEGLVKEYYDTGELMEEMYYEREKPKGPMVDYYKSGNIKLKTDIQNEFFSGSYKEYYDKKIPGTENKKGLSKEESGVVSKEMYFKDRELVGPVKEYYESGKIKSTTSFTDRKTSRLLLEYYESGAVKSRYTFLDNNKHGQYLLFFEDGTVEEEGYYKEDRKDGLVRNYKKSGKLASATCYKNGEQISQEKY